MPGNPKRVDSSFLAYYEQSPAPAMPSQQQQQDQRGMSPTKEKYAFVQPNARVQSNQARPMQQPQPAYRPHQQQTPPRNNKPIPPNIQVSRAPSPPRAAFLSNTAQYGNGPSPPHAAFSMEKLASPVGLSPNSPIARKASTQSEMDDRFGGSTVGSTTAPMDFWKRFSMVMHDAEMEEKGGKKKQNTWLKKQIEGRRKYKLAIWCLTLVILVAVGAALAWHFTHNSHDNNTEPSQHNFGLSPATSTNPLAGATVNAGPQRARRTAIPSLAKKDGMQMHRRKRLEQGALHAAS